MYRVVVHDLGGDPVEEVPARGLRYGEVLNGPGAISFVLDSRSPKCTPAILAPGERELRVWRGSLLVWGGYLWTGSGTTEGDVAFTGGGYFSRLRRRVIDSDLAFTTDQFSVAWSLIDFTQSKALDGADLGIRRFSTALSGVSRERTYFGYERKNLGEAIEQLAAVDDGFDFEVSPAKEWKTYYPRKASSTTHRLELGKNIRQIQLDVDASDVASDMGALGEGEGPAMLVATASDVSARLTYGLLESTIAQKDVSELATLTDHATEALRVVARRREQPSLVCFTDDPAPWEVGVGDTARVVAQAGWVQIDRDLRIISRTIEVSAEGEERMALGFAEVPA